MSLPSKTFSNEADLVAHLKTHRPSFYHSARTSTVIPYDKLDTELVGDVTVCNLSAIPGEMKLLDNGHLWLKGAVSWQEADAFLRSRGRAVMTSPTEQLALVTGGVATSCTGERCFAFGNLRQQIVRLKYLDHDGVSRELRRDKPFTTFSTALEGHQEDFKAYADYKNAPFPRFERETDLMIGTEGQLGIVTEVEIETVEDAPVTHVFLLLPRWEENFTAHLEIFRGVQAWRGKVISCELLDANCMSFLPTEERLGAQQDVILMEIRSDAFEHVYNDWLCQLGHTPIENVFEIPKTKFHKVRAGVPRGVFEENSRMGVKKMGTDCQVSAEHFEDLLLFYRQAAKLGVRYNLFGHFGDAHLHYNYMPRPEDTARCQEVFLKLYNKVLEWHGSPFAEHGVGLLKQKYIRPFLGQSQWALYRDLKKIHDPYGQFFPQGFMSME